MTNFKKLTAIALVFATLLCIFCASASACCKCEEEELYVNEVYKSAVIVVDADGETAEIIADAAEMDEYKTVVVCDSDDSAEFKDGVTVKEAGIDALISGAGKDDIKFLVYDFDGSLSVFVKLLILDLVDWFWF